MTFEQALDNPTHRRQIDAIEDLRGSLEGREDDQTLNRMLDAEIEELKEQTGIQYDPRT